MDSKRLYIAATLISLSLLAGCGDGGAEGGADRQAAASDPAAEAAALDQGPRAGAVLKVDPARAERGAALFDARSCTDCHTLGEADLAPNLLSVFDKRTLPWLRRQIRDPEWMAAHDSVTQALVEEFGLEMVDMGVTAEEAEDILHHLKRAADAAAP